MNDPATGGTTTLKYPKQVLAAAGVIVTAGAIACSGLTAASASPAAHRAAHPAARAAHPAVRAAASGTEHFQLMTTSPTSPKSTIIAYGVFTAGGVDHSGNKADKVKFPGGTFRIRHGKGHGKQSLDPKTCLLKISEHGRYKLADGTGKYAGLSGHGRYRLRILAVARRRSNGQCGHGFRSWEQVIKAHGPASL